MNKMWLIAPLFALSGCSLFTGGTPFPLQETEPSMVAECRKVGEFPGPEGYRIGGPPVVLSDFKWQTAEKAKQMGATHIYWMEDVKGIGGITVGFAFDCTGVRLPNEDDDGY